jgi:NDP-sugar pyrophosphorylase family protein
MIAGIIAAGEGSRLRADGITAPKPLVPVGGVPIIERLLLSLHRCGISAAHCIINEESTVVREYVEGLRLPLSVSFLVKSTPSSMHSLFELSARLAGDPRFLLTTVDSIFDEGDLRGLVAAAAADPAPDGFLAVTDFVDDENPLWVEASPGGRILSFSKAPGAKWVTGGLYVLSGRVFDEIGPARRAGMERLRNFLSHLAGAGYDLRIFPFSRIVDVDRAGDIRQAERMLGGPGR